MSDDTFVELARRLEEKLPAICEELELVLEKELPELIGADGDPTRSSIFANVSAMIRFIGSGGTPSCMELPLEATGWPRMLVHRGLPADYVIRGYQAAGEHLWRNIIVSELEPLCDSSEEAMRLIRLVGDVVFPYVRETSVQALSEYEDERERAALSAHQLRLQLVEDVLADRRIDTDSASRSLGYPLDEWHVSLLCLTSGKSDSAASGEAQSRLLSDIGRACRRPVLVSSPAADTTRAWMALGTAPLDEGWRADLRDVAPPRDAVVVVGAPGRGIPGFRRTYAQASRLRDVVRDARRPPSAIVLYEDSFLPTLAGGDLEAVRWWIAQILGGFDPHSQNHQALLTTVRVWFDCLGRSQEAAEALGIHRNTLAYRLNKAERLLGHPLTERRLETELALALREWFG